MIAPIVIPLILWYLAISIAGWLTFPLAYRLLPALADRGYAVSRILGWLLWGFFFWLLASLGFLQNNPGGILFALGVLVTLSAWALHKTGWRRLLDWIRHHSRVIIIVEVLFLLAFIAWAVVRAANPEAVGTEKPMELAFINAILASPTFPPHDPWLSGYAISYYYFGYVLVAMLARITAIPGSLAFNLGISLVFALSAVGSYGLVYNLLAAKRASPSAPSKALMPHPTAIGERSSSPSLVSSLLGPLFILLVSNLEGFLHLLHTRGLFWSRDASSALHSLFWSWLDILDLKSPPVEPFSWNLTRFWWWWRASRVLQDYDLHGYAQEIIDEFPAFSYLLGDLHPHVLAMPLAFLAMTLALNLFLGGGRGTLERLSLSLKPRSIAWAATLGIPLGIGMLVAGIFRMKLSQAGLGVMLLILAGLALVRISRSLLEHGIEILMRGDQDLVRLGLPLYINLPTFLLLSVVFGAYAFMNTWDLPFYLALLAGAYALHRTLVTRRPLLSALGDFIWLGVTVGLCGILLYLPFFLGFSSQAGGILPNLINPTRGAHLWVMFAPLLIPLFAFLLYQLFSQPRARSALRRGGLLALGFSLFLWIISLILGALIVSLPQVGDFYQGFLGSDSAQELFRTALQRRLLNPGGWITLLVLLTLALALFARLDEARAKVSTSNGDDPSAAPESVAEAPSVTVPEGDQSPRSAWFVLLLILWGCLLVLGPEFLYLRDQFGWRMNTIFKFYFQAWLMWGIAASYAVAQLSRLRRWWVFVFQLGMVLLLTACLVYPLFGLWSKTNGFSPTVWTLDSAAYFTSQSPDEADAIAWLHAAPLGVVAEAVAASGGSYTNYARVSALSGQPAVLGWMGHESQWRGGGAAMGSRQNDLARLYCGRDWNEARDILDRYQIRYIFVGTLERSTYRAGESNCPAGLIETKFLRFLNIAYQQGPVTIYTYSGN
ncbi:MAG: DUF2298 domain-containing protein [Chloroflexota bacterium]